MVAKRRNQDEHLIEIRGILAKAVPYEDKRYVVTPKDHNMVVSWHATRYFKPLHGDPSKLIILPEYCTIREVNGYVADTRGKRQYYVLSASFGGSCDSIYDAILCRVYSSPDEAKDGRNKYFGPYTIKK